MSITEQYQEANVTLVVTSDTTWTAISQDTSWCTLSQTTGSSNANITVHLTQNANTERTTTIRFTGDDASSVSVSVKQNKQSGSSDTPGNAVDIGLSVKWADRNIGASTSTDNGDYLPWAYIYVPADYALEHNTYYRADNPEG
jgi:hypothetical protein